jgi:hypothetical protein
MSSSSRHGSTQQKAEDEESGGSNQTSASSSSSELRKAAMHVVCGPAAAIHRPVHWGGIVGTPSPASTAPGSALECMVQKLKTTVAFVVRRCLGSEGPERHGIQSL